MIIQRQSPMIFDSYSFLDFLAQLWSFYFKRKKNPKLKTFQSVILAGVTDVKNLKGKLRPDQAAKVNSPWNIAVDLLPDMSLSAEAIAGMLTDYEEDHNIRTKRSGSSRFLSVTGCLLKE